MAVVSISLPDALLQSADRLIGVRGFGGRSEFVRASVRDFLNANPAMERTGLRTATTTLVYPEGHERAFSKLRHTYSDVIRSMMHGHARDSCVEVFVLEGKAERIVAFGDALRGTRDALQVSLVFTDAWRDTVNGSEEEREEAAPARGRSKHRH